MIINIRGTNGSGKSTVVRDLMELAPEVRPLFGLLGIRDPEAYQLRLPRSSARTFVLGPYLTPTGGCDAVHPFDTVLALLRLYCPKGHVVFEGSLVSDHYGRVGRFLEQHGKDAVMAFMPTTLEECLRRVADRRASRGRQEAMNPENTTARYASIEQVRAKVEEAGVMRTMTLPGEGAAELLAEELR